jgi:hypothetical protein
MGVMPPKVKSSGQVLLYGLPWVTAVCAFALTLLTRLGLRAAMLADVPKSAPRGWEPFATIISLTSLSGRAPFLLFLWGQITWLAGLVLSKNEIGLDAVSEVLVRNPIVACTGLMIGLCATRVRELINNFIAIALLGVISWFSLAILLGAPFDKGSITLLRFFEAFLRPYLIPCVFGFGLRALVEGRWADAVTAAHAKWSNMLRLGPRGAPRPAPLQDDPDRPDDKEGGSGPTKKAKMKATKK